MGDVAKSQCCSSRLFFKIAKADLAQLFVAVVDEADRNNFAEDIEED
ncbi:MAG: hypothetical protein ACTS2F_05420 [Thainema sp.]